jgi:hypothetical protein
MHWTRRHPAVMEFIENEVPIWLKPNRHMIIRRDLRSNPRRVLVGNIRHPLSYAVFCICAPFLIMYGVLKIVESIGLIEE